MARTKIVNGVTVPLSPAEEAARDAEEAAWTAGGPDRARAAIDAQMDQMERSKLLARGVRENGIWSILSDYVRDSLGVNPATINSPTDPLVLQAIAALSDPANPKYNVGFVRLKAFDDLFVALRAQRAAIVG
jgi:hypothetical protein